MQYARHWYDILCRFCEYNASRGDTSRYLRLCNPNSWGCRMVSSWLVWHLHYISAVLWLIMAPVNPSHGIACQPETCTKVFDWAWGSGNQASDLPHLSTAHATAEGSFEDPDMSQTPLMTLSIRFRPGYCSIKHQFCTRLSYNRDTSTIFRNDTVPCFWVTYTNVSHQYEFLGPNHNLCCIELWHSRWRPADR